MKEAKRGQEAAGQIPINVTVINDNTRKYTVTLDDTINDLKN